MESSTAAHTLWAQQPQYVDVVHLHKSFGDTLSVETAEARTNSAMPAEKHRKELYFLLGVRALLRTARQTTEANYMYM